MAAAAAAGRAGATVATSRAATSAQPAPRSQCRGSRPAQTPTGPSGAIRSLSLNIASRPADAAVHARALGRCVRASAGADGPTDGSGGSGTGGSRTQRIFYETAARTQQAGGAGGGTTYESLQKADAAWAALRTSAAALRRGEDPGPAPTFVCESPTQLGPPRAGVASYDVLVAGGTLGIFTATALQRRGWRVAVLEAGPLVGRAQDWNVSRRELCELIATGVLSREETEAAITVEFNPGRAAFHRGTTKGGAGPWAGRLAGRPDAGLVLPLRDVLNLGVSPAALLAAARKTFVAAGGVVLERTPLRGITVGPDGVEANLASGGAVRGRLLLDAMGHGSPVVRQARWGAAPDGVCLVVGTCARGFEPRLDADIIATADDIGLIDGSPLPTQLFWEAFPAGSGPRDRTTYMFSYMDADARRPSLEALLEAYWSRMPAYQGVRLEDLEVQRILFGAFPTYTQSPLAPSWPRLVHVGDASGVQSPVSFGGFGATTRHLGRLAARLHDALAADALSREDLRLINPYMPSLSSTWLFQRAMSVPPGKTPAPDFINALLGTNFASMARLGDPVLRPFLQDVVQFSPLGRSMAAMTVSAPLLLPEILRHAGVGPIVGWVGHFFMLALYTALSAGVAPVLKPLLAALPLSPRQRLRWALRLDAWHYGAGLDYVYEPAEAPRKGGLE